MRVEQLFLIPDEFDKTPAEIFLRRSFSDVEQQPILRVSPPKDDEPPWDDSGFK